MVDKADEIGKWLYGDVGQDMEDEVLNWYGSEMVDILWTIKQKIDAQAKELKNQRTDFATTARKVLGEMREEFNYQAMEAANAWAYQVVVQLKEMIGTVKPKEERSKYEYVNPNLRQDEIELMQAKLSEVQVLLAEEEVRLQNELDSGSE